MKFGSVCSGIEAASVAWHPLGWKAAWLAEIEPFPCSVLAHHYPDTPNLGDMTTIARRVLSGEVEAPDVLTGGTPCQAFSVAGLRESLADSRGNLTLKFVELADAIDHVRVRAGEPASVVVWENVTGVLSTKDNAFGCFLAGLAGEDDALEPPGGRWSDAGAVYGPARAVAWRTLDAQYFGLAQRRRRVFVVASARARFDPAQVLFEWQGVRRDSAPGRQAGESPTGTLSARTEGGGGLGTDFDLAGGVIANALQASDGHHAVRRDADNLAVVAGTLQAGGKAAGSATQQDAESGLLIATAYGGNNTGGAIDVAAGLNAKGGAGRMDFDSETFVTHSLRGEGFDASEDGTGRGTPLVPVNFQASQSGMRLNDTAGTLDANYGGRRHNGVLAFDCKASGQSGFGVGEVASTMRAMGHAKSHQNAGGHQAVMQAMQVRRLTPRECERLQGFPDDYTLVPHRNKDAADGPRYKALGNSWAVPVARWVGQRVAAHLEAA